jgi:hypothetical protein
VSNALLDFTPVVGDVKSIVEANNAGEFLIALGLSLSGPVGDVAKVVGKETKFLVSEGKLEEAKHLVEEFKAFASSNGASYASSSLSRHQLREGLAEAAGIPRGFDSVWGASKDRLKETFKMDGYEILDKSTKKGTSGNAQVFEVRNHPFIKEVQFSPSTLDAPKEMRSTHVGQYYKFTYKDGSTAKVIDPKDYMLANPEKNTVYYNREGQEIVPHGIGRNAVWKMKGK